MLVFGRALLIDKPMFLYAPLHGNQSSLSTATYFGFRPDPEVLKKTVRCRQWVKTPLSVGDVVNITNVDGYQQAVLALFDEQGQDALPVTNLHNLSPVHSVASLTSELDSDSLAGWLKASGKSIDSIRAVSVFDACNTAGDNFTFQATCPCTLWLGCPLSADAIALGGGGLLQLEVSTAQHDTDHLPEPLGPVRDEFRVTRASARAYTVAKGEYIQVIDVQGQQCSDFMALRADALDKGLERCIDSTVTRTQVRGAYPAPGLADKFFDQDMRPLLAVVQDTVGRHDTFALACTERGYEERGYPGHINCSDNISHAFNPYGIGARKAWPAVNFFFNSWIQSSDNRLASDEAWSRPGDYVLMQALTDLVCVSTACPDDIDPINGWNPTDVHVRIYAAQSAFPRAIARRTFPHSDPIMTEQSAFHSRTSELTTSMQVAGDYWLPASYDATRAIEEYWACRRAVTIQDMSSLIKYDVQGPDAERLLNLALSRNINKLSINRAIYALMLSDSGYVIDDGTLFRLEHNLFRWCCGSEDSALQLKQLAEAGGMNVWIRSLSGAMPSLAVQGPRSRELLTELVFTQPHQSSIQNLKWFGFTIARLRDREGAPFMLSRTGFTGELGYEIFCHPQHALSLWDALMEVGDAYGIKPMGSEALNMLRIEAGLMAAGAEFGHECDALESGLGFAVDFEKEAFTGRAALLRNRDAQRRALVGLVLSDQQTVSHGDPVFSGHVQQGVVTSAVHSPLLGCDIAMARVAIEVAATGTQLEIGRLDGRMKRLVATVTDIPFVDPKRERARA